MSVSSISDLSRQHMLSILGVDQQHGPASTKPDQASPFAQMLADLQQMERSNPKQYSKITHQISADFSREAGKAQSAGNTSLAAQLTALSGDFSQASATPAGSSGATTPTSQFSPLHFMSGILSKVAGL